MMEMTFAPFLVARAPMTRSRKKEKDMEDFSATSLGSVQDDLDLENPDGAGGLSESGDAPDSGGVAGDGGRKAPNLRDVLANSGLDPEQIEALDKQFVHKAALQPKREAEKAELAEVKAALNQLGQENRYLLQMIQQGHGGQPNRPQTATEQFMAQFDGDDESAKDMQKLFGAFADAIRQDVVREMQGSLQPIVQANQMRQLEQGLEKERQALVAKYGKEVDGLWPTIRQQCLQFAHRGQTVFPEQVLWMNHSNKASDLLVRTQKQKRQRENAYVMEGFGQAGAGEPPPPGIPRPNPAARRNDSPAAIANRVLMRMRGGLQAQGD